MARIRRSFLLAIVFLSLTAPHVHGQFGLGGNTYIEKQLLCALDRAPCDNLGRQIRAALPEIIGNNCAACDAKQLANAKRMAIFIQNKYPAVWNALVQKYGRKN